MTPEVTSSQSMNERIKEFRSDPEKMDVTTKFVNEVVEKAKSEALKRMKERDREKEKQRVPNTNFEGGNRFGNSGRSNMSRTNSDRIHNAKESRRHFGQQKKTSKMAFQSEGILRQDLRVPLLLQHGDASIKPWGRWLDVAQVQQRSCCGLKAFPDCCVCLRRHTDSQELVCSVAECGDSCYERTSFCICY